GRAVGVVAGEGEVAAARDTDCDDLAVRLDRHPVRLVVPDAPEVGRLLPVAGEARVERAVGVVAGEREVLACNADRDYLAIRLERHPPRLLEATEVGR